MKNLTVALDDDTYRRARVAAAEAGRSVTSVVRDFLQDYAAEPTSREKRKRELHELYAKIDSMPGRGGASDRLTREEMYEEILGRGPGKGRG